MASKRGTYLKAALAVALVAVLIGISVARRGGGRDGYFRMTASHVMGTEVSITVAAPNREKAEKAAGMAYDRMAEVERLMTIFREDSEVSVANRKAASEPVALSPMTYECVERALHFGEVTGGAFDITVRPLIALWRAAAEADKLPSEEEIAEALARTAYGKVRVDAATQTVRFSEEGVSIDLGGIAKGYAVDRAYEAIAEAGHPNALVDIGGDLYAGGLRDGRPWRVGIQDPRTGPHDPPKTVLVIEVSDRAVATSGNYRRFGVIEGQPVSHIKDPRTGQPVEAVPSVTIVAPDCVTADALATGVSVMGLDEGLELVNALPGVEALLITIEDGELVFHRSSGFAAYE